MALPQRNLKRMLAYSSIAHAGYLLLGLIAAGRSLDTSGSSAVLFYLGAYTFMNIGAFGILVWIRNRRRFGYTLDEIAGPRTHHAVGGDRHDPVHGVAHGHPADWSASGASSTCSRRSSTRGSPGSPSSP